LQQWRYTGGATPGKRSRNLINEERLDAGKHTAWWDGLDNVGRDMVAHSQHVR